MGGVFDYHNASLEGDPRWASAASWTRRAPLVVLIIFFVSVIEIILGAVWISALNSDMTVPKIIQTLIFPGLAFFNAVPSLHLHCLLRNNPPILAIWFSGIFVALWLASFLLFLISCNLPASSTPLGLRKIECSTATQGVEYGPTLAVWWIVVMLELVLLGLYGLHTAMAVKVLQVEKRKAKDAEQNGEHGIPLEFSEYEQQKARERWREIVDL